MSKPRVLSLVLLLSAITVVASAQVIADSISIEGNYRTFLYNKPLQRHHDGAIVFVLHGSGGNARDMMKAAAAMDRLASQENAVVVYPNGYGKYWNECRKASPAAANKQNINEEAFFKSMISYFQNKYAVDQRKAFVVGTSGGGHMAYKLALTMPEYFKAITAIIANLPDSSNLDCAPSGRALPVMIVNGTADTVNPYGGGEVVAGFSLGFVRSTDKTFEYWAKLAGHNGAPQKEILADKDPNDGKIIERFAYRGKDRPEVVLLKVVGGKHDYPRDIDVHVEAWEFFKRQP
jgi:polyhydroxybutyrate depolymerase